MLLTWALLSGCGHSVDPSGDLESDLKAHRGVLVSNQTELRDERPNALVFRQKSDPFGNVVLLVFAVGCWVIIVFKRPNETVFMVLLLASVGSALLGVEGLSAWRELRFDFTNRQVRMTGERWFTRHSKVDSLDGMTFKVVENIKTSSDKDSGFVSVWTSSYSVTARRGDERLWTLIAVHAQDRAEAIRALLERLSAPPAPTQELTRPDAATK
jgi:hypothetical protein